MATPQYLADDDTVVPSGGGTDSARGSERTHDLPRGAVVGRYVVLERVGRGGMGTVYAAYDPQLDRKIAVKVLGPDRVVDARWRERMLREAQAMARLTHPNVVAVHDSGEHEGGTFIAMEFVEGSTLAAWLRATPRPWHEVVRVYCAAGRGLAAAHAAGLVHRDFKPDNVMLATDGRVLVMDFGLAQVAVAPETTSDDCAAPGDVAQTAGIVGTPAYMAPEQFSGGGIGPWTDQFSFCVALYEGLWGERPFVGDTVAALAASVTTGSPQDPGRSRVPSSIRQAVLRGLATQPQQRHRSMLDLLTILGRDRGRRRNAALAMVAAFGTLVGSFAIGRLIDPTLRRCEGEALAIDDAWTPQRRTRISSAFESTGAPAANDRWQHVEPLISAWAEQWRGEVIDACAATHVRAEQSETQLYMRLRCLEDRRARLFALLDELEQADAPLVSRAAAATHALPSPSACADVDRTDFIGKASEPLDEAVQARVVEHLAVAKARNDAGRYAQGITATDAALDALDGNPAAALRGDILITRGQLEQRAGDPSGAESTLRAALEVVVPAGLHDLAARAWVELMFVVGDRLARPKEALAYELAARLELVATDHEPNLERRLEGVLGTLLAGAGELDQALAHHEAAVALLDGAPPHGTMVAHANYGNALYEAGRYAEALDNHQKAYDLALSLFGPSHPTLAIEHINLGRDLGQTGDLAGARQHYREALSIREQTSGADSARAAEVVVNLATLEYEHHNFEVARSLAERALAIFVAKLGPDHPHVAVAHTTLGGVARGLKQLELALEHNAEVERIYSAVHGPDHPLVALALTNRANALVDLGDHAGALAAFDRALSIDVAQLGPDHPNLAFAYLGKAQALLALGRAAEALPLARKAVELRAGEHSRHEATASAYFCLARATWDTARDDTERRRAIALGQEALAAWRAAGLDDPEGASIYETWLRERSVALPER